MYVKKFIFSKFASLQNYSEQIYYQKNSLTDIFDSILRLPMLPPCIDLSPHRHQILKSPHPMFSTPVGNPASKCFTIFGIPSQWHTSLFFLCSSVCRLCNLFCVSFTLHFAVYATLDYV